MAEVWTRILEASPGTRLLLFDHPPVSRVGLLSAHPRLAALAAEGRVLFWAKLPHDEHLLRKRATCTLALDTESYNGHTSTADMLYAGVPVLTLALPEKVTPEGVPVLVLLAVLASAQVAAACNVYTLCSL